ncbi:unnamed protein product [Symbiodinium necroappetens]|uniref:Uncharacterized protein n=1 Tax=Symbiodinium necroappetens TaxID=1628268 RepID=A0A812T9U7_9DINO|nr:unnamed protein product [Symbiodinium necroappetens]
MPECSLEGLASEWDSDESVREDLRLGKPLIAEVSEKQVDIQMPSKYNRLLLPVLARMRMAAKKLPSIDSFRSEIRAIMTKNKRDPSDEDVDKFSWLIRKNCGFVKMKCRRQEVPDFQQLCLALDPDLQGIVDQINESLARRRARRAESPEEATDDEDGYDDDEDEDDGGEGGDSDGSGLGHHLNAFKEAVGESAPEARDDGPITEVPSAGVPNIEEPSEIGPVVETPSENGPVVEKPSESGPVIEKPGESGPVIEKPSECRPVVKAKPTFTEHVEPSDQELRLERKREIMKRLEMLRAKRAKITEAAVVPASAGPTGCLDAVETQPYNLEDVETPPSSTKPRDGSPDVSTAARRAEYQSKILRKSPKLPYHPYSPEVLDNKASSSKDEAPLFTPEKDWV